MEHVRVRKLGLLSLASYCGRYCAKVMSLRYAGSVHSLASEATRRLLKEIVPAGARDLRRAYGLILFRRAGLRLTISKDCPSDSFASSARHDSTPLILIPSLPLSSEHSVLDDPVLERRCPAALEQTELWYVMQLTLQHTG